MLAGTCSSTCRNGQRFILACEGCCSDGAFDWHRCGGQVILAAAWKATSNKCLVHSTSVAVMAWSWPTESKHVGYSRTAITNMTKSLKIAMAGV